MTTLTLDLPDALFAELQQAAALRHVPAESLLLEMARHNLRELRAEQHFRERAARGDPALGLALLEEIASHGGQG